MKRVSLQNVSVRFGRVHALRDVSVSVARGETTMLVGPNGAGKSTLLHVLLGLVRPERGELRVDGAPRAVDNDFKRRVGYLPEAVAFPENLTGRQVLRFFARARGVDRRRVDEVLGRVGLSQSGGRAVRGYSRGMRQRLGLAQAILAGPELLILDEPTGGLDQEGLSVLWSVLADWRESERMTLISSHDLALLERRITRMCVLDEGRVVTDDTPEGLRRSVSLPQRVHLEVAAHANGEIKRLAAAIGQASGRQVEQEGRVLRAEVSPANLLAVLDVRAAFPEIVVGLRVEEPPLDQVYERLLEEVQDG